LTLVDYHGCTQDYFGQFKHDSNSPSFKGHLKSGIKRHALLATVNCLYV
jgi:hypothetical protein